MNKETHGLIKDFLDLFKSRRDVFANGFKSPEGKMAYPRATDENDNNIELTPEILYEHLKGDKFIGVYPLVGDERDYTFWVALDFDEGDDPIGDALKQKDIFTNLGVASYIERSQSGNGAHLWIFFDKSIKAADVRRFVNHYLIDSKNYDRMFPNQDKANDKYGNLIALPYNGDRYKQGNSCFIDDLSREPIHPRKFLDTVVRNRVEFFKTLLGELPKKSDAILSSKMGEQTANLSGAVKVTTFCKWMKAAKERMPEQNQEPEFYALCLQFAQLEDGERLAYEYGRLHPYSDSRIKSKFEQAKKVNMPHTCKTLREQGFECTCDLDYGVTYPFELATLSFQELMSKKKGKLEHWGSVKDVVIERAKKIFKGDEHYGWPYGWDGLDDLTEIRRGNVIVLGARTSIGKAQPLDSKVLTPKGFVTMGSLSIGDEVVGANGFPTKIVGIYPQGLEDVYEVSFKDGSTTRCSKEHLWLTSTHYERKNKTQGPSVKSLDEIIKTQHIQIGGKIRNNHQIQYCDPINFDVNSDLKLHPYLIGILIGDGTLQKESTTFDTMDKEIVQNVVKYLPESDRISNINNPQNGIQYRIIRKQRNNKPSTTRQAILDYKLDHTSYTKFIPREYLYSSVSDRQLLLQGLLDSDGSPLKNSARGYIEFSTSSEQLKDDIIFLVRSLGGRATFTSRIGKYKKNDVLIETVVNYRVYIRFYNDIVPFKLSRKLHVYNKSMGSGSKKGAHGNTITDIKYIGKQYTQCIKVDSPEQLYITDDFIVTHNTSWAIDLTRNLTSNYNIPCYWASLEMSQEELGMKLMSGFAEVNSEDIQKGNLGYKQWKKLLKAQKQYKDVPIFIDDETKDVNKMVDILAPMIETHGPGLLILDYIELVSKSVPSETMFSLASRVILELKGMARILDIPILALSNFNRKAEQDLVDGQDPMDSWIRNSGLIEQTADVVLYLLGDRGKGILKRRIIIQKERFRGSAGASVNLWFDGRYSKFYDKMPGTKMSQTFNNKLDFSIEGSDALETFL